jgi:hypothetical protein
MENTMSIKVTKVKKQVALNPVAQAVARQNVKKEVLNLKLKLLSFETGDTDHRHLSTELCWMMLVANRAQGSVRLSNAIELCETVHELPAWDTKHAWDLLEALEEAEDVTFKAPAKVMNTSVQYAMRVMGRVQ